MALTIGHLQRNTRNLTFEFLGETVNVTYRPGALTPALSVEIADAATQLPIVTALERLLVSWDVLGEDGQTPLPITHAVLVSLPSEFLSTVFSAVMGDTTVGKATGVTSDAG